MVQNSYDDYKGRANQLLVLASQQPLKQTRDDAYTTKSQIWSADRLYDQIFKLNGLSNLQKSSIWKNKIKVFEELTKRETETDMRLFYFDNMLESANKAIYFGIDCQEESWTSGLVSRGASMMEILIKIFRNEDS